MTAVRVHGDTLVSPGQLDFAVNIWPEQRPRRGDGYPDERAARAAVARRHGRDPSEVLLTNGACEAFWLFAHALRPRRAACVHPSFTEPEAALRAAGCERETLAHRSDVVVVRSLTKLWSLAGVRAGYVLAPSELVAQLEEHRQPWSVNALACAALAHCAADAETPRRVAAEVTVARRELEDALARIPCVTHVWPSAANFLLLRVTDGPAVVGHLGARGIAVRPASSFPGLDADHLRVAVRQPGDNQTLVDALLEI